jgi:branched-chain amino acid aminotransferase
MMWWHQGELVPPDTLACSVNTYSLHYGLAIFEGIRAYEATKGPAVFRLGDHIDRFYRSALALNCRIADWPPETLTAAVHTTLATWGNRDLYIRPLLYLGNGIMGIRTPSPEQHLAILVWPYTTDRQDRRYFDGISVQISRHVRPKAYSQAKVSGNYLASIAAVNSLAGTNYDESILLDDSGYLCEASAHNLFVVRNGELHTPRLTACLEGITRGTVIEIARSSGLHVHERDLLPSDLLTADEAFLTSTASEIVPIRQAEAAELRSLLADSLTRRIAEQYRRLVTKPSN